MKLKILAILMALPFLTFSQSKSIDRFFNKYANDNSTIQVTFPKWLLKSGQRFVNYSPAKEAMTVASKAKVVFIEEANILKPRHLRKLNRRMNNEQFEKLLSVQQGGEEIKLMRKTESNGESQLFFNIIGGKTALFVSLIGVFDKQDVDRILNKMKHEPRSERL